MDRARGGAERKAREKQHRPHQGEREFGVRRKEGRECERQQARGTRDADAQFRIEQTKRMIEILKKDMSSDEKVTALVHEIGHLALHELLEQHKIDLEEYNSKVKELDAKRNKKIDEKGGSWRKEYNNTTDVSRKSDMLRAVAEKSTDKKELTDILDAAKGQVEESNIVADILHKPILKVESANKVLSEDYSPHTKQNVIDWLEHNPEVKKEISKDLIDKAKSEQFIENYKDPEEFCCLFVIDQAFTRFVYIPYPED